MTQLRTETAQAVEVGGKETSTGWIPASAGMGWGTGCDVEVKKGGGKRLEPLRANSELTAIGRLLNLGD